MLDPTKASALRLLRRLRGEKGMIASNKIDGTQSTA